MYIINFCQVKVDQTHIDQTDITLHTLEDNDKIMKFPHAKSARKHIEMLVDQELENNAVLDEVDPTVIWSDDDLKVVIVHPTFFISYQAQLCTKEV